MTQSTQKPPLSRPITCTLGSAELGPQVERWQTLYAAAGIRRTKIDAGLRVSFRPDPAVEDELRALVAIEVECCRWANWSIDAKPHELILEISSTGDGIPVVHRWIGGQEAVPADDDQQDEAC
jgi:hypothetical protein